MAALTLTDNELAEVRLQIGNNITADHISDSQIASSTILEAACDYVFEKVREDIDISVLDADEQLIAERVADEAPDNITNFINTVLKPPQRQQIRRAIIYRCSGLAVQVVSTLLAENAGSINQRMQARPWEVIQASLFLRADEEIQRLRDAFPDDAFPSESETTSATYNLFSLTIAG